MQRDGWELADVLDRAVPGEAVVEVRDHAQIDAMHAGFLEDVLHDAALARGGEEDFVDELLAGVLEERFEGADDIAGRRDQPRRCAGEFNEALERVSEVTNALEMMA